MPHITKRIITGGDPECTHHWVLATDPIGANSDIILGYCQKCKAIVAHVIRAASREDGTVITDEEIEELRHKVRTANRHPIWHASDCGLGGRWSGYVLPCYPGSDGWDEVENGAEDATVEIVDNAW